MKRINEKIMSHWLDVNATYVPSGKIFKHITPTSHLQETTVAKIRESKGHEVKKYSELVKCIAELGYYNRQFNLLFRGQNQDYIDKKDRSKIFPSFFRPDIPTGRLTKKTIEFRKQKLRKFYENLIKLLKNPNFVDRGLTRFIEYYYALIQHYEIYITPLIDLTQSLNIAATFALKGVTEGYVFVFGMPHPHGSISHFIDEEITLIKLQNVSPPNALRPHYQEGYLAGKLPIVFKKESGDNIAHRMIGKYKLNNKNRDFWNLGFRPLPNTIIYPDVDPFKDEIMKILEQI